LHQLVHCLFFKAANRQVASLIFYFSQILFDHDKVVVL
jgi:hypothetical protein